jgi:hypothetical protein
MYTENGLSIDLDSVREVLDSADVITVGFPFILERLLIDLRANEEHGPFVGVVPPAANVQERYLWLGRHRGQFGMPEAFSFFQWPHSTRVIDELDLLAPVRHRLALAPNGDPEMIIEPLDQIRRLEGLAMAEAIVGSGPWQTVWEREPA